MILNLHNKMSIYLLAITVILFSRYLLKKRLMREGTVHWLLLNPVLSVSWKRICLSWLSLSRILFVTEEEAGSSGVLPFPLGGHLTQIRQCWKCSSFAQLAKKIFSRKLGEKLWNYSHSVILPDTSKLSIYIYIYTHIYYWEYKCYEHFKDSELYSNEQFCSSEYNVLFIYFCTHELCLVPKLSFMWLRVGQIFVYT